MRIRLTERKALVILGFLLLIEALHIMLQSNGPGIGLEIRASVLWWFMNAEAVAHIAFGLLCFIAAVVFPQNFRLMSLAIVAGISALFGIVAAVSPLHPRPELPFEVGAHAFMTGVAIAAFVAAVRAVGGDAMTGPAGRGKKH